jgi:hypothetical protein
MSETLTPNSPSQQTPATQANVTDIFLVDQLNPDGVTYTTRGVAGQLYATMVAGLINTVALGTAAAAAEAAATAAAAAAAASAAELQTPQTAEAIALQLGIYSGVIPLLFL